MMAMDLRDFTQVWLVDFEFSASPGERPLPVCAVAREFHSGRKLVLWQDELRQLREPPYPVGPNTLFVAYYASAEIGCHLALGWPAPARILDLYVEFRNLTNGKTVPCGAGLLGALTWFGLGALEAAEKDSMRQLVLRGGSWTGTERTAILEYFASDVDALARLLPQMLPHIDLPRAILRGRYMSAAAQIEQAGVPIDVPTLSELKT